MQLSVVVGASADAAAHHALQSFTRGVWAVRRLAFIIFYCSRSREMDRVGCTSAINYNTQYIVVHVRKIESLNIRCKYYIPTVL